jgi:outer membrane protein OmpA-like peptidoglycan-associated protein
MNARWLIIALLVITSVGASAQGVDDEVATGPAPIGASIMPWDYLRGITTDSAATAARVRIIGVQRSGENLTVRAVLLDSNGNFLRRRNAPGWSVSRRCRATDAVETTSDITATEARWTAETAPSACFVIVDNSITSGTLARDVVRSLQSVLAGLAGQDSIGVVVSAQDVAVISPLAPSITAAHACESDSVPAAHGTSALYSSIMYALSALRQSSALQRSVIVITASDDNGSLTTTSSDVVKQAKAIGASITTVRMGITTPAYVFRYMASATGGRLYTINAERPAEAASAMRELLYGQKQHYAFTIGLPASSGECEDVTVRVQYASAQGAPLSDSMRIPMRERSYRSMNLIAAAFPDSTDAALPEYHTTLASLSEYLMSHTDQRVMLVGHVSSDYTGKAERRGLVRAQAVASYMERYGVQPSQITVRSDGALRPLYYLQTEQWQRTLNNRVELQWLDPDLEPFTIAVEQVATEEMAIRAVEAWEQRGYRCYFEGIVANGAPVYRVKLWGFRTLSDAQNTAGEVKKRFKVETVVE